MKKIALCIGNNEYDTLSNLKYAVNDAEAIGQELENLGYDTTIKTNLNRTEMGSAIFDFVVKIKDCESAILFYAGHGFQVEGDNILAPVDLNVETNYGEIKYNAFPLEDLMKELGKYPHIPKAVILDACREIVGHRGGESDFAPVAAPQGTIIAFATSPGQKSKENSEKRHGIYTDMLLKYMSLPRVTIESVFKKVRESLCMETNGEQIPWEHTSLIGDFYLNPNTIYDGFSYSKEAYADSMYKIFNSKEIKEIVDGLKSHNWYEQNPAIKALKKIKFTDISADDLFVLGRNIYQAAVGKSGECMKFIDDYENNASVPVEAKLHILNGMAYEIYYTSNNTLRVNLKFDYGEKIIELLEKETFCESKNFINSYLCKESERLFYLPGQNEIMEIVVNMKQKDGMNIVDFFSYRGQKLYDTAEKNDGEFLSSKRNVKRDVAHAVGAPIDYINLIWNPMFDEDKLAVDFYYLALGYKEFSIN